MGDVADMVNDDSVMVASPYDPPREPEYPKGGFILTQTRGWICPKCGSVYGPAKAECARCNAIYDPTKTVCEPISKD